MKPEELIEQAAIKGFHWKEGEHDSKQGWFLHWPNPNDPTDESVSFVDSAELPNLTWRQIRRAVIGGRDVHHVTRVVGYYSRTSNWNPSKIGELKDRREGDYGIGKGGCDNDDQD